MKTRPLLLSAPMIAILAAAQVSAQTAETNENGAAQVTITMTSDDGGSCKLSAAQAPAGPVTFSVKNETATALTEVELLSGNRILGEKENLAPGLPAVSFTVTLGGGDYEVYCPGAAEQKVAFAVTGEAAPRPQGDAAAPRRMPVLTPPSPPSPIWARAVRPRNCLQRIKRP